MGVRVRQWKGGWWVFVNSQGQRRARRCSNRKAAELVAVKIDAALKLGQREVLEADRTPLPPPAPRFDEYAERWLDAAGAGRLRPSSVEQYRTRLRVRLFPTLGPLPLTSITRETVRGLIGDMVRAGNRRSKGRPVSRSTVRESISTLSAILGTAEEDGLIPANPARRMGKHLAQAGAASASEVEVFSREELAALLAVAERDWPSYHPMILCLARTGMRLGEAVALEWRDVDFQSRVILVRRSRRKRKHPPSEPKNGKARRVDMSAQLAGVLRTLTSLQAAEAAVAGRPGPERVFSTPKEEPIDQDVWRVYVWGPLLRRAAVRYRKPHTLRHTYASLLIEAGEPLTYVQQQLGHHSPVFTLKVYGHLLPRGDRRAVDALDDATICNPRATEQDRSAALPSLSR